MKNELKTCKTYHFLKKSHQKEEEMNVNMNNT